MNRSDLFDAIVVGGGPVGAIVAKGIAENSLKVGILEEHGTIGEPQHCAGLVSVGGLFKLGIAPSKDLVLNEVRGARIFSSSGDCLTVERKGVQAFVIDRVSLDKALIGNATRCGADLLLGSKVKSIRIESAVVDVSAEVVTHRNVRTKKDFLGKVVVSAEGAQSLLTSQLGFQTPNPRMKLHAIQFEMSDAKLDRHDLVEIFLGRTYAPGFFAWIIPTGSDSARVGLASRLPKVYSLLRHFISHDRLVKDKLSNARIIKIFGGSVLTGGPIQKTFAERFLAVGDCAGQTKPTTGGGVVTGGICARIASKVIVQSLLTDDFSEGFLKKYEKMWRGELGREFLLTLQLRRLLNCAPDALIDKLVRTGSRTGLGDLMERKGEIDLQSQLIKSVILSPKTMLGFVLSFLGIL